MVSECPPALKGGWFLLVSIISPTSALLGLLVPVSDGQALLESKRLFELSSASTFSVHAWSVDWLIKVHYPTFTQKLRSERRPSCSPDSIAQQCFKIWRSQWSEIAGLFPAMFSGTL
jgi:hypothetical protein